MAAPPSPPAWKFYLKFIDVDKFLTKCMSSERDQNPNESLHSNRSTFSIPHVNNFFQITISELFGRFNENFLRQTKFS